MYFTAVIGSGTLTDKIPLGTLMLIFVIENHWYSSRLTVCKRSLCSSLTLPIPLPYKLVKGKQKPNKPSGRLEKCPPYGHAKDNEKLMKSINTT
jgi:hypothetical protein